MSSYRSRALLVSVLIAGAALGASLQTPVSVRDAVERYAAGDYDAIRRLLSPRAPMVVAFTNELESWIAAAPEEGRARRRAISAAFALETSWAATRNLHNENSAPLDTYGRFTPSDPSRWSIGAVQAMPVVSAWVARQLPSAGLARPVEELFWYAASGLAQDGHAWRMLQEAVLEPAKRRLGDDPRLRLAEVVAQTNRDLGSLRQSNGVQRPAGLKREPLPSGVTGRIPEAIAGLDALKTDKALAGEVDLRVGYLELRRNRYPEALTRLDAARESLTEPVMKAAADYLAGWIHEQQDRTAEAVAAYRRASFLAPDMPTVATRLSALLYLQNERDEAYNVLDRALNARPAPRELLITLERGDARFMPQWLKQIREAVR